MTKSSRGTQSPESNRVRLTLDLSYRLNAAVDEIAAENDSTKADVIRSAIEFIQAANRAKKDGKRVGAWSVGPDGSRDSVEFVGI